MNLKQQILAVALKEIRLELRFKVSYFLNSLIGPVLTTFPFFLVYYGFLHFSPAQSFAGIGLDNYINFLVLGMTVYAFYNVGLHVFKKKFFEEKYWKTLEGLFASPVKHISIVLGFSLSETVRLVPALVLFMLIASYFILPSAGAFILALIALYLVFLLCLGVGLFNGALAISNENYLPVLEYFFMAWTFASCFFYPVGIFPDWFKPLVLVNPVYQGLFFIREAWISNMLYWNSFIYLLGFAMAMPIIGMLFFRRTWKKKGIQGY